MYRILAVDDHHANCIPLVKLFKFVGIEGQCAFSGPEALASLAVRLPDVVLLDVMMPEMDGFDVLRLIRAEPRYNAVMVLMYTAVVDPQCERRARQMGAQGYIVKGTSFADLRGMVEQHLQDFGPGR